MRRNLLRMWQIRGRERPYADHAGFALLEVMAALFVLTVAVTAFLAAIVQNVRLEEMNAESVTAMNAANKLIETIKTMEFADITVAGVPATFTAEMTGNDGKTVRLTDASGSNQVGHVTIQNGADPKVRTVLVEVTWRSITGSERTIRLMTEVTDY